MSADVQKDEWTPQLEKLSKQLSPAQSKRRLARVGYQLVAVLRTKMTAQQGFADGMPYRRLKIKYRYHGHKDLIASKANMRRRARGAVVRLEMFQRGGEAKLGKVISVVDKTKVTPATKALIDLGDLRRSWDVLRSTAAFCDIGNRTPLEKLKAYFNDDRGRFSWGRVSTEDAVNRWCADFDKAVFSVQGGKK